jgi:hypothetical protein
MKYFDANIVGARFVPAGAGTQAFCAKSENIFALLLANAVNYLSTHIQT